MSSSSFRQASHRKHMKSEFLLKQPTLLVLEFKEGGDRKFREMRRDEILNEARQAIPIQTESKLSSKRRSSQGILANPSDVIGTLRARDIRLLDDSFSNAHDPAIVVKRHAVLINLPPIKALILFNKCYLIVPDGADSILTPLIEKLEAESEEELHGFETFDLNAMEAIFRTVSIKIHEEVERLEPRIKEAMDQVNTGTANIDSLRQLKQKHSILISRVTAIQHAYMEVLENDRDMALMNLSRVREEPEYFVDTEEEVWAADHEEVELLLENYLQAVDGSLNRAKWLNHELEAGLSLLMVHLDSARNNLLRLDIYVSAVTTSAAIGAFLVGIFGMNLSSGIETSKNGLMIIGIIIFVVSSLFAVILLCYMKCKGLLQGLGTTV